MHPLFVPKLPVLPFPRPPNARAKERCATWRRALAGDSACSQATDTERHSLRQKQLPGLHRSVVHYLLALIAPFRWAATYRPAIRLGITAVRRNAPFEEPGQGKRLQSLQLHKPTTTGVANNSLNLEGTATVSIYNFASFMCLLVCRWLNFKLYSVKMISNDIQ